MDHWQQVENNKAFIGNPASANLYCEITTSEH